MLRLLIILEESGTRGYYGPSNVALAVASILEEYHIDVSISTIPTGNRRAGNSNIGNRPEDLLRAIRNTGSIRSDILSSDVVDFHYIRGADYLVYPIVPKILCRPTIAHIYFPLSRRCKFFLAGCADFLVSMNQYVTDHLENIGVSKEKIRTIPPPIDTDLFKRLDREALAMKYGVPLDKFTLLYHGRPTTVRGLMLFLDLIAMLRKEWDDLFVLLSVADVGNEDVSLGDIQEYIRKHELQETVRVMSGLNKPYEMYGLADVVLFPFLRERTVMCPPLSVLEAMATESVVVSTPKSGLGSEHLISSGKNGFLTNPTIECLAAQVEGIRDMERKERERIGRKARETIIKECSRKVVGQKTATLVKSIC